ncbi:MAG: hypothetical protein NTX22_11125 [Ignavibacteriales bacterium]|nr:hypothetical protein [Ignavibacteriales bacterium]
MLEKITNINPDSNYKGEKKSGNFLPAFSKANKHFDLGNDAIHISPAMHFVLEKGWHLRELKEFSGRKIFVSFIFVDFEIQSEIDFDKLLLSKKIVYKIIKTKELNGSRRKLMLVLNFNLNKSFEIIDDQNLLFNLRELEILFDRISQLDIKSELNCFDTSAIRNLMDDIYKGLTFEFNYITTNLLLFFERVTKLNCRFIKQEEEISDVIKIEKIVAVEIE